MAASDQAEPAVETLNGERPPSVEKTKKAFPVPEYCRRSSSMVSQRMFVLFFVALCGVEWSLGVATARGESLLPLATTGWGVQCEAACADGCVSGPSSYKAAFAVDRHDAIGQCVVMADAAAATPAERLIARGAVLKPSAEKPSALEAVDGKLNDDDLALVAELKGLKSVKLTGCAVSAAGVKRLVGLESLKVLGLDNTAADDAVLEVVGTMVNLEELLLTGTKITDSGLKRLAGLKKLKRLRISDTQVGNEGLKALAQLAALADLDISKTQVTSAGVAELAALPALVKLNLYTTQVGDPAAAQLAQLPKLKWLNLDATAITDAAIPPLAALSDLEFLHLGRTVVTDASVESLAKLSKLKEVHVTRTKMTPAGAARLRTLLPACTVRDVVETP